MSKDEELEQLRAENGALGEKVAEPEAQVQALQEYLAKDSHNSGLLLLPTGSSDKREAYDKKAVRSLEAKKAIVGITSNFRRVLISLKCIRSYSASSVMQTSNWSQRKKPNAGNCLNCPASGFSSQNIESKRGNVPIVCI